MINFLKIDKNTILIGTIVALVIFILNMEVDPKLRNIWYRTDVTGIKVINFSNIRGFFIAPFKNLIFWYPRYITINPYLFCYTFLLVLKHYHIHVDKVNNNYNI